MAIWAWAVRAVSATRLSTARATAPSATRRWCQFPTSHPPGRLAVPGETASGAGLITGPPLDCYCSLAVNGASSAPSLASENQGDEPATEQGKAGRLGDRRRHEPLRGIGDSTESYDPDRAKDAQDLNRGARSFEHMELVELGSS